MEYKKTLELKKIQKVDSGIHWKKRMGFGNLGQGTKPSPNLNSVIYKMGINFTNEYYKR